MVSFYNVVCVYLYKIGEEKFGGWWWSFSWLGQSNPVVWHLHCVCDCPNEYTGPLLKLWSIQGVTKTVLLLQAYEQYGILLSRFSHKDSYISTFCAGNTHVTHIYAR